MAELGLRRLLCFLFVQRPCFSVSLPFLSFPIFYFLFLFSFPSDEAPLFFLLSFLFCRVPSSVSFFLRPFFSAAPLFFAFDHPHPTSVSSP